MFRPTEVILHLEKITAPTVNDDQDEGYLVGDLWVDETNNKSYQCLDNSVGAAVWTEITQAGGGVTSHLDLTDIGTTTHADIDTHIGDGTKHFTEGSIDHGSIGGLEDDDHPQYIKDSEFTQNSGVLVGTGIGTFQEEEGAILRTSLGVDPAGTDNSTDVTLNASAETGGMSLAGQEISNRAATSAQTGYATAAHVGAIEANTLKETNVPTALSIGTKTGITLAITSDGGADDVVLPEADTDEAGLLGADKWDEIVANTAAKHTQGSDVALGTLGTKNPPIDADKAIYRDSTSSDALVTSTWTQVKAFLKTYFDTLYQAVNTALLKTTFTTKGDILVTTGASTPTRLAIGSDDEVLTADNGEASGVKWAAVSGGSISYVKVSHVEESGTAGGTFTQGAWRTRPLNTEDSDEDNICTLSSNQLVLDAGTYKVEGISAVYDVNLHQCRLYNVTGSAVLVLGITQHANSNYNVGSVSEISGKFIIAASQSIELQHYCVLTKATQGFGVAADFGTDNVFAYLIFEKVA